MDAPARIKKLFPSAGWLRPWMLTSLLALGYVLFTLARNAWDPMAFVMIGRQFDPAQGAYEMGYDGQFAYQIALDPAGAAPTWTYRLTATSASFTRCWPAPWPWVTPLLSRGH